MPTQEDYSREAWSRRKGESTGEERPRRRYNIGKRRTGMYRGFAG